MKQRRVLGIGLGLILAGLSGTVQAQSIYNSIGDTNAAKAQIKLYDSNSNSRRGLKCLNFNALFFEFRKDKANFFNELSQKRRCLLGLK